MIDGVEQLKWVGQLKSIPFFTGASKDRLIRLGVVLVLSLTCLPHVHLQPTH